MTPRFRGKGGKGSVYIPSTPQYRYAARTTGTTDKRLIRRMETMLARYKDDHAWEILNLLHEQAYTLSELFDAYQHHAVGALVARVTATDLAEHIDPWLRAYRASGGAANNVGPYRTRVSAFVKPGTTAADITPGRFREFLTGLDVSSGTRRHYLMAMRSFIRYAREAGVMKDNPLAEFKAPKKNPPRKRWVTATTDQMIADATTDPRMRALFALVHGTGADLSAIVAKCRAGDIDVAQRVVVVRATKTGRRDRHAILEPWAVPYVRAYLAGFLPGAKLFDGMGRYAPSELHRETCAAIGVEDYTLRDARHSVAVRMLQAGRSYEDVAEQLGTSTWQAVNTYTKRDISLAERLADPATDPQTPILRKLS